MTMDAHEIYERTSLDGALAFPFEECETRVNGTMWKPDVVIALIAAQGNLSKAAQLLGKKRLQLRRFIDKHLDIQELLIDMRETKVDMVEEKQFELANEKDGAAGRFILQTLGKDRGYTSRNEVGGPDGGPIKTANVDVPLENLDADKQADLLASYLGGPALEALRNGPSTDGE